jgi:type II secretory pathway pseudopilin PulG/fibronectin type 3 domain-containing protein
MKSHSRRGEAGFSFVELLVTIIIAAIAFAAMVPVFVSASEKGQGDTARNVALNLAREKIEKVRELDYDEITETNLDSAWFKNGSFGTSIDVANGAGTKTYIVDYNVTFVGGSTTWAGRHVADESSGDGSEQYKRVTVDVYWTGKPQPVKHAVLETIVYKQYVGSRIDSLSVSPKKQAGTPTRDFVSSYTIVMQAKVNAADIARTNRVIFRVYGANGVQLQRMACYKADTVDDGTAYLGNGLFKATYAMGGTAGSKDGTYSFKATAVNSNGFEGDPVTVTLPVDAGAPPQPGAPTAVAQNAKVELSWAISPAGDVTSYKVYRSTSAAGTYALVATVPVVVGQLPTYTDTGLSNGTTYYYKILAVDVLGAESALSGYVSAAPAVPADTTRPGNVAGFTVTVAGTQAPPLQIKLVWNTATDNVGVTKYSIYRKLSTDASYPVTPTYTVNSGDIAYANIPVAGQYTFVDGSGIKPLLTYDYQIVAADAAGNVSLTPATGFATALNYQYCKVTVKNNYTKSGALLRVVNTDGTAIAVWPSLPGGFVNPTTDVTVLKNGSADWYLPLGFSFKAGWKLTAATEFSYKSIPASGVIVTTTPFTVSFP